MTRKNKKYTLHHTELVWRLFTTLENNSAKRISEMTDVHINKVNKIINEKLGV